MNRTRIVADTANLYRCFLSFTTFTYPLTAGVVGAPQITSLTVSSMYLPENRKATIASFEAKLTDLMSKPGM